MECKRVVVTGLGAVTPVGLNKDEFWSSLINGVSGIGPITRFDAAAFPTRIAAEVKGFDPLLYMDRKAAKRTDRFAQLALAAAKQAFDDAKLDGEKINKNRVGTFIGSGIGGMETMEEQHKILLEKGPGRISPFFVPMMISNMAAGQVAIAFGFKGPALTVNTACATGTNAIGDAFRALQHGLLDMAVAGGTEAAITPLAVAGFCAARAMSTRNDEPHKACRPFDNDRDGFVMGEGSGIVVLETLEHAQARGATIYAEVVGFGSSDDAFHETLPSPGGEGAARCMAQALDDAHLTAADVDYINAHGTSTDANDKFETMAIKTTFGEHAKRVAVSSTKSMTGHLLGAAGAIEFVATVMAVNQGIIPPTINYETPDPECDLDYVPNTARRQEVKVAMSNNFGFGGHNATIVVKRY